MIVVLLYGGLGNQMFQYAIGKSMALARNCQFILEPSLLEDNNPYRWDTPRSYNLDIFSADIIVNRLENINFGTTEDAVLIGEEETSWFKYDVNIMDDIMGLPDDCVILLKGFWQSPKYFNSISNIIKSDFKFRKPLEGKWKLLRDLIDSGESVMVHVRRTDYLKKEDYFGVVSIDYIMEAIDIIKSHRPNAIFYVFSDDVMWCKSNIPKYNYLTIIDDDYADPKCEYYFQIMTKCKHFIIANSTFSWWAAYLGEKSESIVVCPKKWFLKIPESNDLIPENWIRI